jgi:bisphosphoglycerate-independent phosphoglycerate mutase (AlkP superfamily)
LALYHEFTNQELRKQKYNVPLFEPEEAGIILTNIARQHHFTLYEHFLTDILAHRNDSMQVARHLNRLSRLIRTILDLSEDDLNVFITSDHGNIEDSNVRTHTRNPVPFIWQQKADLEAPMGVKDITDITPYILSLLGCNLKTA